MSSARCPCVCAELVLRRSPGRQRRSGPWWRRHRSRARRPELPAGDTCTLVFVGLQSFSEDKRSLISSGFGRPGPGRSVRNGF